ncbi:MAG: bifunctional phosphopantothenoylcysteine decarboxylase/phosphopantothenate--cysteine ligase CoaBC, partial [Chloroflexi bacterium]|nr:bifunctional phosphopantothenoylcysteine decarboxylase/phosphopantothenate--cysteine ligase CoaBC [Chloroflexota bacterium]
SAAPVVVAPAMDGEMYAHPATQANVDRLRSFGYALVEPEVGPLASGATGQGRLAETARILDAVVEAVAGRAIRAADEAQRPPVDETLREPDLEGRHLIVTAGGTAEPIDPVRFIGNRSTGRMGVALAEAALRRGARVTLICGATSVPLPAEAEIRPAPTAAAMRDAVLSVLPQADALIMAAAVADFRPTRVSERKVARSEGLILELEPTDDILAEATRRITRGELAAGRPNGAGRDRRPVVVGFAAETGSLDRAPDKAERKGVDLLVANDITDEASGFGSETNRVTLIVPGSDPEPWPVLPKIEVAHRLLDRVSALLVLRDALNAAGASSVA